MTTLPAPQITDSKGRAHVPAAAVSSHTRLAAAIDEYYAEVDAGAPLDRQHLLEKYSDVADELAECLTSFELIRCVAPQLAGAIGDPSTPRGASRPGPTNLGDFRLVREIGRGGMGVVYEAEQLSLERRVAVKILPFAGMLDQRQLGRFKNEARAAASLQHPHIVPVYYVGVERGVHFYAMQYIEGQSLAVLIADARAPGGKRSYDQTEAPASADAELRLPPAAPPPAAETLNGAGAATLPDAASPARFRVVAELGVQAAQALHYAHESGVIHRDVKPSNLLLGAHAHLWVADFGLARVGGDATLTMTGDLVGTLRYMSPEQLRGKAALVDHRTDLYSLGVTLYELLTLRPAFDADTSEKLLREVAEAEPPAPRSLNPAIPRDLETIVLKSIRKDAGERYATAQDFADDLQRYLEAKPIFARRPTLFDRAVMWTRRHTGVAIAVGGALLATTVVAAIAALLIGRSSREKTSALQQANDRLRFARRVVDDMYTKVAEGWLANQPRMTPLQEEFLEKAAAFYREVAERTADDPHSDVDAALAAWRLARIDIEQRRLADAEPPLRRAIGQLDLALQAAPDDPERQHARALIAMTLATLVGERGDAREAAKLNAEAGAAWSDLARRFPADPKYIARQADIWQNLGTALAVPEPAAAEPHLRQAIAGYKQALAADYQPSQTPIDLARTRINLSVALDNLHRHDEARAELVAALAHLDETGPLAAAAPDIRALAAGAWYQLARQHRHLKEDDEARRAVEQAISLGQRLVEEFPDRPVYQRHLDGAVALREKLP